MCSEVLVVVIEELLDANHAAAGATALLRYAGSVAPAQPALSSGLTVSLEALRSTGNTSKRQTLGGTPHWKQLWILFPLNDRQHYVRKLKCAHILRIQMGMMGHSFTNMHCSDNLDFASYPVTPLNSITTRPHLDCKSHSTPSFPGELQLITEFPPYTF